jgi:hypothetical protein
MRRKPKGRQGDWFADYRGQRLPCLKSDCWHGAQYHDPYVYDPAIPKHAEYLDALRAGRAILAKQSADGTREDYICLLDITDVEAGEHGLRLTPYKRTEF